MVDNTVLQMQHPGYNAIGKMTSYHSSMGRSSFSIVGTDVPGMPADPMFTSSATGKANQTTVTYTYDPSGLLVSETSTVPVSPPSTTCPPPAHPPIPPDPPGLVSCTFSILGHPGLSRLSSLSVVPAPSVHGNDIPSSHSPSNPPTSGHSPSGPTASNHSPSGPPPCLPRAVQANHLYYDGQYLDATSDLYCLKARWYDPATAQFTSVDPLVAKTLQPYEYAGDDPVNGGDLSGMCECIAPSVGAAAAKGFAGLTLESLIANYIEAYTTNLLASSVNALFLGSQSVLMIADLSGYIQLLGELTTLNALVAATCGL